jgi:uncharacterized membrane protein YphA (DoxX/SURF4 family)
MELSLQNSSKTTFWIYRLLRISLGIIFIWSGFSKLIAPKSFATIIEAYGLIPEVTILPAAIGLSLLEVAAGVGLVMDVQWSLGIVAGLLILFTVIIGYGLWIGLDVDCGCFGPDDPEGAAYHSLRPALYRDMIMLAGIGYLFLWRWQQSSHPVRFSDLYQFYTNIKRRK